MTVKGGVSVARLLFLKFRIFIYRGSFQSIKIKPLQAKVYVNSPYLFYIAMPITIFPYIHFAHWD